MKIAVATDTNSSISKEMAKEKGIFLLEMPVIIDGIVYMEGKDITHEDLYQAMKEKKDISTTQPSIGHMMELWEEILSQGYDEILFIPMSSGLSSTCHNAIQAAKEYDGKVVVVDNHRISITQIESIESALKLVKQGLNANEIKDYLEARANDNAIYVTVDSLEYLKKGGRLTPAVATLATILSLKPVLTVPCGDKLDTYAKVRGMKRAEMTMIEAIRRDRETRFKDCSNEELIINIAGTFEDDVKAQRWLSIVQEAFPNMDIPYYNLPCSIACHTGMNACGISIMKKEV